MPKPYNTRLDALFPPCYCGSVERIIRDRGPHIGLYCGNDHKDGPNWIPRHEFVEGGQYFGLLPAEDFSESRRRESKEYEILEHVRVDAINADHCLLCKTPPFRGYLGGGINPNS